MSAIRPHRRLMLATALLACLAITFLALPAQTQGRCGNEFYYYSDENHTELVGWEVYECNCAHFSWGQRTPNRVIEPLGCPQ